MQAAFAPRGDSRTFLTHFVGDGLEDDRYVVQRYLSQADGDIVPVDAHGTRPKGRRRPRPTVVSLKGVEKLRPARDEIIIATGTTTRTEGALCPKRAPGRYPSRIRRHATPRRSWAERMLRGLHT